MERAAKYFHVHLDVIHRLLERVRPSETWDDRLEAA
jgi:hypothetical protein